METGVSGGGDLAQITCSASFFLRRCELIALEGSEPIFQGNAEWDQGIASIVCVDPCLDFRQP